ncbi:MAG: HutD family protein [Bacteroidetes bacterium]|nr:HutD family protein [Bacteroidota bacterium]
MVEVTVKRAAEQQTTSWSGGTTTQLFIHPATADYLKRDFQFRLSSAVVKAEQAEFTRLPGVSRKLIVLNGAIRIRHQGHHEKTLKRFDVDVFEGDWTTTSVGQCTDFNVMTTGTCLSSLNSLEIPEPGVVELSVAAGADSLFVYLVSGELQAVDLPDGPVLFPGDLLQLKTTGGGLLRLMTLKFAEAVIVTIFCS